MLTEFKDWIIAHSKGAETVVLFAHHSAFDQRVLASSWKSLHGDDNPPWKTWLFSCSHEYVNSAYVNKRLQQQFVIPFGQRSLKLLACAYDIPYDTLHLADKDVTVLWKVIWNVFAERTGGTTKEIVEAMIFWAFEKKLPEKVRQEVTKTVKPTCVAVGCKKTNVGKNCSTRKCKQHCLAGLDPCKSHKG